MAYSSSISTMNLVNKINAAYKQVDIQLSLPHGSGTAP